MSISCGFYNSVNGDRRYGSPQMSALFDGVINDGVFMHVGGALMTTPGSGMSVIVAPGRAWFDRTWTYNDSDYPITIAPAEVILNRIDAIVLETNSSNEVRDNTIKVVKGTPASTAKKPKLTNTSEVHQHPLAYVTVNAGVSSITGEDIEIMVGKTECPFVTAILETTDITALMNEWQSQFDKWFANVEYTLSGDAAGKLQTQIDGIRNDFNAYTPYHIGDVKISAFVNTDPNWALCNGDPIDKTLYKELYDNTNYYNFTNVSDMISKLKAALTESYTLLNIIRVKYFDGTYFVLGHCSVQSQSERSLALFYSLDNGQKWTAIQYWGNDLGDLVPSDFWVHEKMVVIATITSRRPGLIYSNDFTKNTFNGSTYISGETNSYNAYVMYCSAYEKWLYADIVDTYARFYFFTDPKSVPSSVSWNHYTNSGNPFEFVMFNAGGVPVAYKVAYNDARFVKIGESALIDIITYGNKPSDAQWNIYYFSPTFWIGNRFHITQTIRSSSSDAWYLRIISFDVSDDGTIANSKNFIITNILGYSKIGTFIPAAMIVLGDVVRMIAHLQEWGSASTYFSCVDIPVADIFESSNLKYTASAASILNNFDVQTLGNSPIFSGVTGDDKHYTLAFKKGSGTSGNLYFTDYLKSVPLITFDGAYAYIKVKEDQG